MYILSHILMDTGINRGKKQRLEEQQRMMQVNWRRMRSKGGWSRERWGRMRSRGGRKGMMLDEEEKEDEGDKLQEQKSRSRRRSSRSGWSR